MANSVLFNPAQLSREELKRGFLVRGTELEELLSLLESAPPDQPPQHALIIGWRGMGKSTLLHRLAYAIEDDPALGRDLQPVLFDEEQYNIGDLADFWLNGLRMLGLAAQRPSLAREAEALARRLDGRDLEETAYALLKRTANELRRRLVLLVDNADLVLNRLEADREASQLRSVLQHEPWLHFIGASSQAIEATYDYRRPFYELFKVIPLAPLDDDEVIGLLHGMARGDPGLLRNLDRSEGRIRGLQHLVGGNPRTLAILFEMLRDAPDGDLSAQFDRLLDLHTPLYKDRLEGLSPQMQRVFDALAQRWDPATADEIAGDLRLTRGGVSGQLAKLEGRGLVEKVDLPGRAIGYQIRERFFNLWCLMRGGRRSRQRLRWLVEFIRLMVDPAQAASDARRLRRVLAELKGKELPRPSLDYALALAQAGVHPGASAELLHELVARDPRDASLHVRLGKINGDLGRHGAAELAYREALAIDPTLGDAATGVSCSLLAQGRFDDARAWAEQQELGEAETSGLSAIRWMAALKSGDPAAARAAFGNAEGGDTASMKTFAEATALVLEGEFARAAGTFPQRHDDPAGRFFLAWIRYLGALKATDEDAQRAAESDFAELLPMLGAVQRLAAFSCLHPFRSRLTGLRWTEGDLSDPRRKMLDLLWREPIPREEMEQLRQIAGEVLASDDESWPYLPMAAGVLAGRGDTELSLQSLARLHALMPRTVRFGVDYGRTLEAAGRVEESRAVYTGLAEGLPDRDSDLQSLIEALVRTGATRELEELARRLIDRFPNEATGHLLLGSMCLQADDHQEAAERVLTAALKEGLGPENWTVILGILARSGLGSRIVEIESALPAPGVIAPAGRVAAARCWLDAERPSEARVWLGPRPLALEELWTRLTWAEVASQIGAAAEAAEVFLLTFRDPGSGPWLDDAVETLAKVWGAEDAAQRVEAHAAEQARPDALWLLAARLRLRTQDDEAAIANFRRVGVDEPHAVALAMYWAASVLLRLGRLDEALAWADGVPEAARDEEWWEHRLSLLSLLERHHDVVDAWEARPVPGLATDYAMSLASLDQPVRAIEVLRQHEDVVEPDDLLDALLEVTEAGDDTLALEAAAIGERAIRRVERLKDAGLLLALLQLAARRPDEALLWLERSLVDGLDAEDDDAVLEVAVALARQGQAGPTADLLDKHNLSERLAPLRHALAISSGEDPGRLVRLAPEMRALARELIEAEEIPVPRIVVESSRVKVQSTQGGRREPRRS